MNDHDRFLLVAVAVIFGVVLGIALGSLWSAALSGSSMSAMLVG